MSVRNLYSLSLKKEKIVVGLMSGTSVDGISAGLVKILNSGKKTALEFLGGLNTPFPKGMRERILAAAEPGGGSTEEICRLNFFISLAYVKAVKKLCKKFHFPLNKVDLIGSHGQTIHHLPSKEKLFGFKSGSTLQIGDISVISKQTGVTTVGDFRTADVALGGEGAPFVPYFDYIILSSQKANRALLNIGGIANITALKKNAAPDDVIAFDTGPGNMLIDSLMQKFYNKKYDRNGAVALSGKINNSLLQKMADKDTFLSQSPPKSTGREFYSKEFINFILKNSKGISFKDIITTTTFYTAWAVYYSYIEFISRKILINELYVSGGGAKNKAITSFLKMLFGKKIKVENVDSLGIDSDFKEAICFAVLANETISGNPANLPTVTGASKQTILGKISLP